MSKRPVVDVLRIHTANGWTLASSAAARLNAILRGTERQGEPSAMDFNLLLTKTLLAKVDWPLVPIDFLGDADTALVLVQKGWFVRLERFSDGWYCEIKPHSKADEGYRATQVATMAGSIVHAALTAAGFRPDKAPWNVEGLVDA